MLFERVAGFVRGDLEESFETLALEVFRHRYRLDAAFRELCDRRGSTPETVPGWRGIPVVEAASLPPPVASGDQAGPAAIALGRAVVDRSFPAICLEGLGRPPVLSLVPTGDEAHDPGLATLAERVLEAWAAPDSAAPIAGRRVEAAKARSFLAARQRDRRPTLILATPDTLAQLLETLERRGLRFRLPPGSRAVACGGAESVDPGLQARLAEGLDVGPDRLVGGYGVPGLRSRFYAGHRRDGEAQPFRLPPWARVRVLDPDTGAEVPPGTAGALTVCDLASPEAGSQVLTGDLATAGDDAFRLAAP